MKITSAEIASMQIERPLNQAQLCNKWFYDFSFEGEKDEDERLSI